jgi:chromosome partitioning protein
MLEKVAKSAGTYLPGRRAGDHLQVITVINFKGGSGKTTTAAHLAQKAALDGYRVLAIDLDPQASLSALHGFQPEPCWTAARSMTPSAKRIRCR